MVPAVATKFDWIGLMIKEVTDLWVCVLEKDTLLTVQIAITHPTLKECNNPRSVCCLFVKLKTINTIWLRFGGSVLPVRWVRAVKVPNRFHVVSAVIYTTMTPNSYLCGCCISHTNSEPQRIWLRPNPTSSWSWWQLQTGLIPSSDMWPGQQQPSKRDRPRVLLWSAIKCNGVWLCSLFCRAFLVQLSLLHRIAGQHQQEQSVCGR